MGTYGSLGIREGFRESTKEECKGVQKGLKVINRAEIYLGQTRERLPEKKAETTSKKVSF